MKKIVIILISIIIVVAIGVTAAILIGNNFGKDKQEEQKEDVIAETKKKISSMSAEQVERDVIEQLKKSAIYVNNGKITTTFKKENDGFVTAHLTDGKNEFVAPLFKVNSDRDGNLKNIQFIDSGGVDVSAELYRSVNSVFKDKYGIVIRNGKNDKYSQTFLSFVTGTKYITYTDLEFAGKAAKAISDGIEHGRIDLNEVEFIQLIKGDTRMYVTTFGIQ